MLGYSFFIANNYSAAILYIYCEVKKKVYIVILFTESHITKIDYVKTRHY